jgi:recombination protein RecR
VASPYTPPVQVLIDELGRLPGIGPRSAQRLALHLIKADAADVERLARAISEAKARVRFCERCFNLSDGALCNICSDTKRESRIVCVVEDSRDIAALERTGEFRGRYHVLLGLIDPLQGINPENLKVRELLTRIKPENIEEVVVCTSNNTEGDVTAMYLARLLAPIGVTVSRLASGLPVGGDIEFADEITLGRAFGNRLRLDP